MRDAASRIARQLVEGRERALEGGWEIVVPGSLLLKMLIDAVGRPGFLGAYRTDVFRHREMPSGPRSDA
jgi:hypothetical protein